MKLRNLILVAIIIMTLSGCGSEEQLPAPALPRPEITVTEEAEETPVTNEADVNTLAQKPALSNNSYNVTLEVNPSLNKVLATEKISYKNRTEKELERIYIRFNINAFSNGYIPQPFFDEFKEKVYKHGVNYSDFLLTSITVNSEKVGYEINGRNIGVLLETPLPPDSNIDITMQFECTIPDICHKIGANADAMWFGNFIPVAATYNNGEFVLDQYYPAGEPFVYEMSNFDVTVITPANYSVYGTGIEKITENDTNKTTRFTINMVRDFAFAISDKYKTDTIQTSTGVTINFHHYTDNPQKVAMVLDAAAMSVDFMTDRAGAYPYQVINIAETELPQDGANAFPCIIFIDSGYFNNSQSFDSIGHEISRQWFYNTVGNDQIREAWLGVGLTTYLQMRMNFRNEMVEIKMRALHASLAKKLLETENYSLYGDLSVYTNWDEYYDVHYNRAALMFHALYRKMGADKWIEFTRAYFTENSFKIATKKSFIDIASNVYGERLDDFVESWMSWREIPNLP